MAKLKNVSAAEVDEFLQKANDLIFAARDISRRIEKGYCDDIETISKSVRSLNMLTRESSTLVGYLLLRASMQDQPA